MSSTVKVLQFSKLMKKKIVLGYVAMVVILAISGYFFYVSFILAQKVDFERVRLERGQISVFQFCSEIGKLRA